MNKTTFVVDLDNVSQMRSVKKILNSRLNEIRKSTRSTLFPSQTAPASSKNAEKIRKLFDCYSRVYDADISFLYNDLDLDENPIYYVYAHLDTTRPVRAPKGIRSVTRGAFKYFLAAKGFDFCPFYVGKGVGDRYLSKERNLNYQKIVSKMSDAGKEPKIIKLKENLTESEALQLESKLIDVFGLALHDGLLTNLDEGHRYKERIGFYLSDYVRLRRSNRERYGSLVLGSPVAFLDANFKENPTLLKTG